jgi:hypothetical protein
MKMRQLGFVLFCYLLQISSLSSAEPMVIDLSRCTPFKKLIGNKFALLHGKYYIYSHADGSFSLESIELYVEGTKNIGVLPGRTKVLLEKVIRRQWSVEDAVYFLDVPVVRVRLDPKNNKSILARTSFCYLKNLSGLHKPVLIAAPGVP